LIWKRASQNSATIIKVTAAGHEFEEAAFAEPIAKTIVKNEPSKTTCFQSAMKVDRKYKLSRRMTTSRIRRGAHRRQPRIPTRTMTTKLKEFRAIVIFAKICLSGRVLYRECESNGTAAFG
jgi:hypothetical protein